MANAKSHRDIKDQDTSHQTGLSVKRDSGSDNPVRGRDERPFKGVGKEALEKLGPTLNKLAKYDKR